jgi:hypothetical protein
MNEVSTINPSVERSPLAEKIQKETVEKQRRLRRFTEHMEANEGFYEDIINALTWFERDDFDLDSMGGLEISLFGGKADLARTVRALRRFSLTPTYRPKEGDTSWTTWWTLPSNPEIESYLEPRIWFRFASSECKRVKVGTRVEEVDVFETQCGDSIALEDLSL